MKFFRNRIFVGTLSLLVAAFVCFVLAPTVNQATNRQTEIIRVVKAIPEGTAITKDMIQTVKVGGFNLPQNIINDEKNAIGKYTTAALDTGDYILTSKVSDTVKSAYLSALDGEKEAISISIKSFAAGLSGKLQSGDIVSLIVSDYGDTKQTVAPAELRYVLLLAATTAKGTDTDQKQSSEKKDTENDEDNIPATLTLLVTPEQATKLVDYETNGKLYATLVYRGSEENSQRYLKMQDDYLSQQPTGSVTGTGGVSSDGQ
ncbi:Flp pilus assembly protein CpaB [Caproiciproducens faecalis]|uniref:Flp pilus assembly protein CpaB n=1 Tax=Caproiciproducens faecalis TaxID=2820301 RepID=A0ABS7DPY4_9FIRM|nr:Flp pilus assembly protein CpaB [Caproiciproducens faecalis]MBW7573179.1 Flp pilus assembly protein CpaB [Caproiciproducens faecalis]